MQCTNPILLFHLPRSEYPDGLTVPCGKCLHCRISKRKEWTFRMLHELQSWDHAIFITLTYDDQHIPDYNSLIKKDLQNFFKRLRKNLGERKIKYFACGEYGTTTDRPHYHAIIYGMSLLPGDKNIIMSTWKNCDWQNRSIKKNSFGLAEQHSIEYVAGYIHSKLTGELADQEYKQQNREPVFRILSLGIGLKYALENKEKILKDKCLKQKGKELALPRYYLKKLEVDTSEFKSKAIERDCEETEKLTGIYVQNIDLYKSGNEKDVRMLVQNMNAKNKQKNVNAEAKLKLKQKSL
nr:MAG: replication initiator protein [Microvirus sp.]